MANNGSWAIREAGQDDADALALVGSATFLETFAGVLAGAAIVEHCARANSAQAYRTYLERGAKAWLAEIDPGAAPIGFALLTAPDLPGARKRRC
jgi:diamine N-acetyltransferase